MSDQKTRNYIANLPIGAAAHGAFAGLEAENVVDVVDINKLPDGIVTGSNLLQFNGSPSPELKASVVLSLLAAQRVAANDPVVQDPDQWIERHNTVLKNLYWRVTDQGVVDSKFENVNVAVHKAIIPFITAAFGAAATAGSLIVTALKQLAEMDANSPWITLFDKQSRRFNVTEFQFAVAETAGMETTLRLASARFDASYGQTQVLFFKITKQDAKFRAAKAVLAANSSLLAAISEDLKIKLAAHTQDYIRTLKLP